MKESKKPTQVKPRLKLILSLVALIGLLILAAYSIYAILHPKPQTTIQPPTEKILVATVGDSITYGPNELTKNRETDTYPAQLQVKLGNVFTVKNFGSNARTLLSSGDYPYKEDPVFAESIKANPDVVVIMLGTNDAKPSNWNAAQYEKELAEFVELYKSIKSKPHVYLVTVPAVYNDTLGIPTKTIETEVVPAIRRVSGATQTSLIDVFYATKNRPELFIDGVHPTKEGNILLANVIYDGMRNYYRNSNPATR